MLYLVYKVSDHFCVLPESRTFQPDLPEKVLWACTVFAQNGLDAIHEGKLAFSSSDYSRDALEPLCDI